MGLMDSLSSLLSGGQQPQQQQMNPQQMQGLGQLLAQLQSGGGSAADYQKLMQAYNPAPKPRDYLSDLGSNLSQAAKASPYTSNFSTLGSALSNMKSQGDARDAAQQAQYQKSLTDMIALSGKQREMGQKDTAEDNKVDYQDRELDSLDNYRKGELGVAQGNLGVAQQNANNGKFDKLGIDNDGNAYIYSKNTGDIFNKGKINLNTGGKGRTTVPVEMDKAFDKIIDQTTGVKGIDGKVVEGISPLDPQVRLDLKSKAAQYIMTGQAPDSATALKMAFNDNGGLNALQEMTTPGKLFGQNTTGFRNFKDKSLNAAIKNVAGAPTVAPNDSDTPDNALTPMKGGIPAPRSRSEFATLPAGTKYIDPNGNIRVK